MRIGILTFHRAYNCGAMLQAWALKKALERMGHTVEFPACNHVGESPRLEFRPWRNPEKRGLPMILSILARMYLNIKSLPDKIFSFPVYDILRHHYRVFRGKHLPERKCNPSDFAQYYDLLISGSDQVFNEALDGGDTPLFLCENKPKNVRAIAYAASYGDKPLEREKLSRVVKALGNFTAVSMREAMSRDQLAFASGREIDEVLDPSLLMTAEEYEEIAEGNTPKEPYLFCYTVHRKSVFYTIAQELAKRLGVKCVIASCYHNSFYRAPKGIIYGVDAARLLRYVKNAKYVLAASFHGTAMSVVFNKQFLSLRGQVDEHESRPASLLRKIGCSNRLVNPTTSLEEMERLIREPLPDYSAALDSHRAASLECLFL